MYEFLIQKLFLAIDASGKFPAGILDGHIPWEGDYQGCKNMQIDYYGEKYIGRYCTVLISLRPIINAISPQLQIVILPFFQFFM